MKIFLLKISFYVLKWIRGFVNNWLVRFMRLEGKCFTMLVRICGEIDREKNHTEG